MWSRARLAWAAWTTDPSVSDEELAESSRQVTKALAQTLDNRSFRRPALTAAEPGDTAAEQQAFDQETIEQYHDRIAPELEPVRTEFIARGHWTVAIDELAVDPASVTDLRDLIVRLEDLTARLDAADQTHGDA